MRGSKPCEICTAHCSHLDVEGDMMPMIHDARDHPGLTIMTTMTSPRSVLYTVVTTLQLGLMNNKDFSFVEPTFILFFVYLDNPFLFVNSWTKNLLHIYRSVQQRSH